MIDTIKDIIKYRKILWVQVITGIKLQFINTKLGIFWIILEPIILMCIYYFLLVIVFHRYQSNFILFILPPLLCWQWFAHSLGTGIGAIQSSSSLLRKKVLPLIITIIPPILVFGLSPLVGLILLFCFDHNMTIVQFLLIIPILLIQLIFTIGITTILATFNIFIPDIRKGLVFLIRIWWFLSPVLYSADRILDSPNTPDLIKRIYLMNPFVFILSAYRSLFNGQLFSFSESLRWCGIAILVFCTASWLIKRYENDIKKTL